MLDSDCPKGHCACLLIAFIDFDETNLKAATACVDLLDDVVERAGSNHVVEERLDARRPNAQKTGLWAGESNVKKIEKRPANGVIGVERAEKDHLDVVQPRPHELKIPQDAGGALDKNSPSDEKVVPVPAGGGEV